MPKKAHAHKSHHHGHEDEKGFIGESTPERGLIPNTLRRTMNKRSLFTGSSMNKNEKIIMGLLVGGIVTFLILSIVLLFGRGGKSIEEGTQPEVTTSPAVKVLTTPYPTVPPITDFYMQVNEDRFYPDTVNITRGHVVTILNIGISSTTITPTTQGNTKDFGVVEQGEEKTVMFDAPGVYRYTRTGKPDQILTITVSE